MNWTNARFYRELEREQEERRRHPRPWFADSTPCELCGEPCDEVTIDPESGCKIGTDCSCQLPDEPMCPKYAELLEACDTVSQLSSAARTHKENCIVCSGKRKPAGREVASPDAGKKVA